MSERSELQVLRQAHGLRIRNVRLEQRRVLPSNQLSSSETHEQHCSPHKPHTYLKIQRIPSIQHYDQLSLRLEDAMNLLLSTLNVGDVMENAMAKDHVKAGT